MTTNSTDTIYCVPPDPDLLAIQRRRRQARRCLRCNVHSPRATLCDRCQTTHRYCPGCESVYPVAEMYPVRARPARASEYCLPCGRKMRNGNRTPRAEWLAQIAAQQHPLLDTVVRLYRRGLTYEQIAAQVAVPREALASIIRCARVTGRWPAGLRRGRDWRKGKRTKGARP